MKSEWTVGIMVLVLFCMFLLLMVQADNERNIGEYRRGEIVVMLGDVISALKTRENIVDSKIDFLMELEMRRAIYKP